MDHTHFFNNDNDIYFSAVYMWSDNSPIANLFDADLFTILEEDINHFQSLVIVMIAGDFNARTACKSDGIICDLYIPDIDSEDYIIDTPLQRYSMDSGNNSYGNKLLDMCKGTGLRIANGRLGSDFGVGKYTCFNRNGSSVIDYLILSQSSCNCRAVTIRRERTAVYRGTATLYRGTYRDILQIMYL